MKEIYYTLKETKFLEPIRSLKIRSIPHESLKAVFLYTEWIYTLFYEDILTDTREIPQNYEIKYTHFHNSNWYMFYIINFSIYKFRMDGLSSEDMQAMLSIVQ